MIDLDKQYGIEIEDWRPDISLGDIVELTGEKRGD